MSPARPSVYEFIARASSGLHHAIGAADAVWHVAQVERLFCNFRHLDRRSREALLGHADKIRDGLSAILRGLDDAIAHYRAEHHEGP